MIELTVYIIGAGCWDKALLTAGALEAIDKCGVVIGSERMVKDFASGKKVFYEYRPENIKKIIDENNKDTAILVSGDTGIYSAAQGIAEALLGYDVKVIPGISALSFFSSKINIPWQDWKIVSIHGRRANVTGYIRENEYTFVYLSDGAEIKDICRKLELYGMGGITVYAGERLSCPDERIGIFKAGETEKADFKGLCVALFKNEAPVRVYGEIPDSEFIRGKTPMTKAEIRTLSLSKLGLKKDSVLYDVGSGTGSVSVAAALTDPDIRVYSIERNQEALELTRANRIKFAADNIHIIEGEASDVIKDIDEAPTAVFIGGSGGKLEKIISECIKRNENVRFALNAVTLNTPGEALEICEKYGREAQVIQVFAAKGERAGGSMLMKAANPIYIITF